MEQTEDDEQSARNRKWQSARQRLLGTLGALGLGYGQDFILFGEDWPQHGTSIGLADESLATADLLAACSRALSEEGEWGALVVVHDPTRRNKMRIIVEISSGGAGFALIGGNNATRQAIFEAYHKLGLGHLLSWKP
jgi:hypothetical protein